MKATYKAGVVLLAAALGLAACGKSQESEESVKVDPAVLTAAINGDLSTAEHNCIAMPVKFDTPVAKDYAKLTDPNGAQLDALVKAGLITATPADGGQVTFTMTDAGKNVYAGLATVSGPGFCGGEVSVASIVEDKVLENRDKFSHHSVTYQYKFDKPEAWQKDAGILAAFPKFAEFVNQAGKTPLKADMVNRDDQGWNVNVPQQ